MEKRSFLSLSKNIEYQTEKDILYELESYFEYRGIKAYHKILFYMTYFLINNDLIPYSRIFKVSKDRQGFRILTIEKELFDIHCERDIKREIFDFFKCLNEKAEEVDPKNIIGTAVLQFGGHYFIVHIRNLSYEDFRSLVLKRIAFHFFSREKNQIILKHFKKFRLFIKDNNFFIPLENSSDLVSALFHYNNRLVVHIKHQKE